MATNRKQSPQRSAAGASSASSGGPRRLGQQGGGGRPSSAGAQRRYERQRSRRGGSKWIGWLAVAAVVIIGVVLVAINLTGSSKNTSTRASGVSTGQHPALASPTEVHLITTIPASVYDSVKTNSLGVPFTVTKNQPSLTKNGKPLFVYEGAEYCPYCAMARYSMIMALSRFGSFSNLKQTSSGSTDGNVPTFSFLGSTYTSPYVAFAPYESLDRQEPNPQPLQKVPASITKLYQKYDGSPTTGAAAKTFNTSGSAGIPFIDIGNAYVSAGDPGPFQYLWGPGQPLHNGGPGRLAIAKGIRNPTSSTGKYINGEAFVAWTNYMTAAVCSLDGGKPTSVCASAGVKAAASALAKAPKVG